MTRRNVAGGLALAEEFFDHAERDEESIRHFLAGILSGVINGQYFFAGVEGESCHAGTLPRNTKYGYSFI